jgi:hypothetical protein
MQRQRRHAYAACDDQFATIRSAMIAASSATPRKVADFRFRWKCHEVQPRHDRAGTVLLPGEAHLVERIREPDPPRVVGPETRCEDDGPETRELQSLGRIRFERRRRRHLGRRYPARGTRGPDESACVGVTRVAESDGVSEV